MHEVSNSYFGSVMILPDPSKIMAWIMGSDFQDPEYRNFDAFDFWRSSLKESARAIGSANAKIDRRVTIERALQQGISRHDMEVALAVEKICQNLDEKEGMVLPVRAMLEWPLFREQRKNGPASGKTTPNENRARAYPLVKDCIQRRIEGRSQFAEPLDLFHENLDALGYGHFKLWWSQIVSELRRTEPDVAPVAVAVLAAALVEGTLIFVVKHGRSLNLGLFGSRNFDEDPRRWKIDDLVASAAASGREAAILDQAAKLRAESLITTRQRIHAGRMLSAFPGGVPDLRPDEAREAKATADLIVRRILDWLERYPTG